MQKRFDIVDNEREKTHARRPLYKSMFYSCERGGNYVFLSFDKLRFDIDNHENNCLVLA